MTSGWLPQRAGLPGLNGGGTAAAVPSQRQLRQTILGNSGYTFSGGSRIVEHVDQAEGLRWSIAAET